MKQWILSTLALIILPIWAAENQREVIDCNIIFEQRKAEIIKEIERIDEQQQALQALQSATQNVLDQKEADLKKREIALNNAQKEMEEREAKIARLVKRNEEILKQIRGATQSKVGETYAGMKDSKSAAILESLPDAEAAGILYVLDTKVMSKILSKMTPQKAATLTQLLQKGPPFEEEKESPQPNNAIQNKENNEGSAI
ncbi:MotE family protein [Helicobacter rodentium]|uniref:MotE family protein n=1 Tax=Helicobacter rodentium TaxID=59617 RepID=UPI002356CD6F|nr:MotE family protein [Helicobacter rodentium]